MNKGTTASVKSIIKLCVNAGQATASPPIGPALGQKGVKAIDFCKQFNEATKKYIPGTPLLTHIIINPDRTFTFEIRGPQTSFLLKKATGVTVCSTKEIVGQIYPQQLYEIAKLKLDDPSLAPMGLENIYKMLTASARHIGIEIVHQNPQYQTDQT